MIKFTSLKKAASGFYNIFKKLKKELKNKEKVTVENTVENVNNF